ncbi:MAG: alpha-L-fucosidase [Planctomycetaceae bacterium]|jgi:alpha-L-fucosidase|nr:alpha-L-fucosidase [Planctomycetaceae bacterium]
MSNSNFSRRRFLRTSAALAAASAIVSQHAWGSVEPQESGNVTPVPNDIFDLFQCPQWLKDAKFGLWLCWGPQSVPGGGGGWYSRHMYAHGKDLKEPFGENAWDFHREHYGHQSQFGYKDICNLWKAENFDAEAMMRQFKKWGARYAAIIVNFSDNFDLFNSSIHGWNATKVGPKRDIVGEFSAAARKYGLKWAATSHGGAWGNIWYDAAMSCDKEGPLKDVPYDGVLTKADGKGLWWEGLDPQQLYAINYPDYEKEFSQRMIELVENYQPDMLYFDLVEIPVPAVEAARRLYANSLKKHGSIQAVVTVKQSQNGTLLDYETGVSDKLEKDYWQDDTTLVNAWFLKPLDTKKNVAFRIDEVESPSDDSDIILSGLRHNARTLKELFVDIISKRGVLLLNLGITAGGIIPQDQMKLMDEFGGWIVSNGEAIYKTDPWKVMGAGGEVARGGHRERDVNSTAWDENVYRFTCNRDKKTLYVHIFGNPDGKEVKIKELADKSLFPGRVKSVSLIGNGGKTSKVAYKITSDGLAVHLPGQLPFRDCNVLKVNTSGLW